MPISKTIKRIKIGEKKVVLIFDNGDKLEISPNTYTEYHFYEGKPLSNKEREVITFGVTMKLPFYIKRGGENTNWKGYIPWNGENCTKFST